jgi:hypothetical protein
METVASSPRYARCSDRVRIRENRGCDRDPLTLTTAETRVGTARHFPARQPDHTSTSATRLAGFAGFLNDYLHLAAVPHQLGPFEPANLPALIAYGAGRRCGRGATADALHAAEQEFAGELGDLGGC